jgi:triosephosphate isomerase (TIM)
MSPKPKTPFVVGNWKMHLNLGQSHALAAAVVGAGPGFCGAEVVLVPPFTALGEVGRVVAGGPVKLGAQNCHWAAKGAFTGEVSPSMLKEAGCSYVLVGHSERRQYFGETDKSVNQKLKAALEHGLTPIFCLGETLEEREKSQTDERIMSQLAGGLDGLTDEQSSQIVTAYEPIWAIGTGRTATPGQAEEVHGFIRAELAKRYGKEIAAYAIILYGGSVKPDNAFSLYQEKNIDGFLVGGASLEADSFLRIIKEANNAQKVKQ